MMRDKKEILSSVSSPEIYGSAGYMHSVTRLASTIFAF